MSSKEATTGLSFATRVLLSATVSPSPCYLKMLKYSSNICTNKGFTK